jgi:hypothetical protein
MALEGTSVRSRVAALPWAEVEQSLWDRGYAWQAKLLEPAECARVADLYDEEGTFRSRVEMARHRFGVGEYKYFANPLPPLVQDLRRELYARLAPIANRWSEALGSSERFPATLELLAARCAEADQTRPTPLVLRYREGGYNCLHQDLYGEVAFPLQALLPLSRAGVDYTGGEFLLVEQRPRAQSAGEVLTPDRGDLVVFTTRFRPAAGARGYHRVNVRHGLSRVRSGQRYALGVIFHDAR